MLPRRSNRVLDGLRSVGAPPRVVLVERSPFTPEPIQP
jgi:hypothetical protein